MSSEETKERILEAASEIFARDGFAGAHVAEIAERADANVSLIYRYFDSKQGLLQALLDRFIRDGQVQRDELFAGQPLPSTPQQLDTLVRWAWDYLQEQRDLIKIVLFESLKSEDPDAALMELFDRSVVSRLPPSLARRRDDEALELDIAAFFFGMMPFTGFLVFGELWAAHLEVDFERARDTFFTVFEDLYARDILERLKRVRVENQEEDV